MVVAGEDQRLIDIADANGVTPQDLMDVLRGAMMPVAAGEPVAVAELGSEGPLPMPASGLGRMTLRSYCERYELVLADVLALFPEGVQVDPDRTLRQLATDLKTDPAGVIEMLNERALQQSG
jgi:hypothetical protein